MSEFKYLVFISSIALLSCCSVDKEESVSVPVIDFEQPRATKDYQLGELAKKIQYIELESITESFIGAINDIVFSKNYIIILDQKQHKVLLFNSTGKFVRKIGNRGNRPQDYGTAFSIEISDDENYVFIYSTGDKILKYTIDGEYDSIIATKEAKLHFFKYINGSLLFAVPFPLSLYFGGYSFGIINSKGIINRRLLKREHKKNINSDVMVCNSSFYSIGDTIVYWQYIYDTIYSITPENTLAPRWVINYGENTVPADAFNNIANLNNSKRSGKFMITNIIESKKHIFFSAIANRFRQLIIFEKETQELFNLPHANKVFFGLENNLEYGPSFWPQYILNDSTMATVLSPDKLIATRLNREIKPIIEYSEFSDIVDRATIRTNHVIMKITLK